MKYKWTSAKEKLPTPGEPVLIYVNDDPIGQKMYTGKFTYEYNGVQYWELDCPSKIPKGQTLLWMPLPPMPNETEAKE